MALLTAQTTDDSSTVFKHSTFPEIEHSGNYFFFAWGTWDGATMTLEFSPDDGTTWVACGANTTLTADGAGWALVPNRVQLRATVSSAGASTSLSADMMGA
jgi:hypothetical protein